MDKMKIGDPESVKLRDKGRVDAWRGEFDEKLKDKVLQSLCPSNCDGGQKFGNCEGPNAVELYHKGIVWACFQRHGTCDCCGQDMANIDIPHTDFDGNEIGYLMSDKRKPFDPDLVRGGG